VLTLWVAPVTAADAPKSYEWKAEQGLKNESIRIPNGGDGEVEIVELAGHKAIGNTRKSHYIYVDLPTGFEPAKAFVTVEFLDEGFGPIDIEYDSKQEPGAPLLASYRHAETAIGSVRMESGTWRKALFELASPGFKNRQNGGCDFRLVPGGAHIASLRVSDAAPSAEEMEAIRKTGDASALPPLVSIPKGAEVTFGGHDNYDLSQTQNWKAQLLRELPVLRMLGATSHETYVVWRCCEAQKGKWDFSHYDACVEAHEKSGLKWVPFVILGSSYTLPDWFYTSDEHVGYRCLEHDQVCDIQSLWAPSTEGHVKEFLKQFAKQYKDRGVIESVLLGITGNYGEAIYPASGNDWTADTHGKYHTHGGMWCGDKYAVVDFQKWLKNKYGEREKLAAAWGTQPAKWDEILPAKNEKVPSVRAWLDTVDWYRDSMNCWVELWMKTTAKEMPGTEIYLCTGGHAPPEHGSEFGIQSKLAAKYKGGVRITNEGSDYAANFAITRWVGSASRFYGGFFGYEPASSVNEVGILARIFNATASGARQLHDYSNNTLGNQKSLANWRKYGHLMKARKPKIDVAVWYPNRMVDLRKGDVWKRLRDMREVCDYDFVDDQMIRDGALDKYKLLVCISAGPYEGDILQRVREWASEGRTLYIPAGSGLELQSLSADGKAVPVALPKGGVQQIQTGANLEDYWAGLRKELASNGVLVTGIRGVYGAVFEDGSVLLLNTTASAQNVSVKGKAVELPATSIVEEP
jgi:hypothetical protein